MNKQVVQAIRSLTVYHWIALVLIAFGAFTAVYQQTSSAACYPGTSLGRACYRGYFTNINDHGGTDVLPVIRDGLAVPRSVDTADELYNLIRAAYNSNSNQRRTGAAFIYNTMMGLRAPGVGRTVTNAQWLDLRNRLRALDSANKISWNVNVSAAVNSFYQGIDAGFEPDGRTDDDAFYYNYKNETGIIIRDFNNNVVYELLRRCANPIGDPAGLPEVPGYSLTPQVDSVSPTQIEPGSRVNVSTSVNNTGNSRSQSTRWEITKITVEPGARAPREGDPATASATAPCQSSGGASSGNYFQNATGSCENVGSGTGRFDLGSPAQNLRPSANNINVDDLPAGTRLCFALSVQPRTHNDSRWMHSRVSCTIVGKKPKVQVWGGDAYVRGNVDVSTTIKSVNNSSRTFGSWVEYGLLATGVNRGMGSGSAFKNGATGAVRNWNRLTFANRDNGGADAFGSYTLPAASNLAAQFTDASSSGGASGNIGGLSSGTYRVTNTTINASEIAQQGAGGKSIVIIASGTVTIAGDIVYKSPAGDRFTSIEQLPQVVIIANRINIQGGVERVDAWLLTTGANGYVNTCSDVSLTARLTTDTCSRPLKVNGPIETAHLHLRRTAGSGSNEASGDPAETFNLRSDAYIWGYGRETQDGKAQTIYTTELPPRF